MCTAGDQGRARDLTPDRPNFERRWPTCHLTHANSAVPRPYCIVCPADSLGADRLNLIGPSIARSGGSHISRPSTLGRKHTPG